MTAFPKAQRSPAHRPSDSVRLATVTRNANGTRTGFAKARRSSRAGLGLATGLPLIGDDVQVHDFVTRGMSARDFVAFRQSFHGVEQKDLLAALGISDRTSQRLAAEPDRTADSHVTDKVVQLAKIRALATQVLGTQDAAEQWLITPALGLEQRRPIDLVRSTGGIGMIFDLLHRMQHGVYA